MKRIRLTLAVLLPLLASGCMTQTIHQGNVFKDDKVWLVEEGDTRFKVETLLGSPALTDSLHPNVVHYVEQYHNHDTGEKYLRGVDITYDDALRVKSIHRFGFDTN